MPEEKIAAFLQGLRAALEDEDFGEGIRERILVSAAPTVTAFYLKGE